MKKQNSTVYQQFAFAKYGDLKNNLANRIEIC